jgi:NAD(P)-dependent dehydrogenase (short-subunit alcohol dehydrogenase family)
MGIGKAIARGLAEEGVNVSLLARTKDMLDHAAEEIGAECGVEVLAISTDLTSRTSVDAAIATVVRQFYPVHILINNAGHRMRNMEPQLTWDDEDWIDDINIKTVGMLRVIRALVPHFSSDGTGRIINVSGIAGTTTFNRAITHAINNSAMNHITGYLARDLAERQVTVNSIVPGLVATEWRYEWADRASAEKGQTRQEFLDKYCADLGIISGRWASMEEVANVAVFLASDRSSYINGAVIDVDGGVRANIR